MTDKIQMVNDKFYAKLFSELKLLGIKIPKATKFKLVNAKQEKSVCNSSSKIFGVSLSNQEQITEAHYILPKFIAISTAYLRKHIEKEGLFRKSGSIARQRGLRERLEEGRNIDECEANDVASLLKQWLRELPEPLIPSYLQEIFVKCLNLDNEESRLSSILLVCLLLPKDHFYTLKHLLHFLADVVACSGKNKMVPHNLALVMAPNIFVNDANSTGKSCNNLVQVQVTELLIRNADKIGEIPALLSSDLQQTKFNKDLDLSFDACDASFCRLRKKSGAMQDLFSGIRKLVGQTSTSTTSQQILLEVSGTAQSSTSRQLLLKNDSINNEIDQNVLKSVEKHGNVHSRRRSFGFLRRKENDKHKVCKVSVSMEPDNFKHSKASFDVKPIMLLNETMQARKTCADTESQIMLQSDIKNRIENSTVIKKCMSNFNLSVPKEEFKINSTISSSAHISLLNKPLKISPYSLRSDGKVTVQNENCNTKASHVESKNSLQKSNSRKEKYSELHSIGGNGTNFLPPNSASSCVRKETSDSRVFGLNSNYSSSSLKENKFENMANIVYNTSPITTSQLAKTKNISLDLPSQSKLLNVGCQIKKKTEVSKNVLVPKLSEKNDHIKNVDVNDLSSFSRKDIIKKYDNNSTVSLIPPKVDKHMNLRSSRINKPLTTESHVFLTRKERKHDKCDVNSCTGTADNFKGVGNAVSNLHSKSNKKCMVTRQETFTIRHSEANAKKCAIVHSRSLGSENGQSKSHSVSTSFCHKKGYHHAQKLELNNGKRSDDVENSSVEKIQKQIAEKAQMVRNVTNIVKSEINSKTDNGSVSGSFMSSENFDISVTESKINRDARNGGLEKNAHCSLSLQTENLLYNNKLAADKVTECPFLDNMDKSNFPGSPFTDVQAKLKTNVKRRRHGKRSSNSDSKIPRMKKKLVTRAKSFPDPASKGNENAVHVQVHSLLDQSNKDIKVRNIAAKIPDCSIKINVITEAISEIKDMKTFVENEVDSNCTSWSNSKQYLAIPFPSNEVYNKRESIAMILRTKAGHVQDKIHSYDQKVKCLNNSTQKLSNSRSIEIESLDHSGVLRSGQSKTCSKKRNTSSKNHMSCSFQNFTDSSRLSDPKTENANLQKSAQRQKLKSNLSVSPQKRSCPFKEMTNTDSELMSTIHPKILTASKNDESIINESQEMNIQLNSCHKSNSYSGHTPIKLPKISRSKSSPVLCKL